MDKRTEDTRSFKTSRGPGTIKSARMNSKLSKFFAYTAFLLLAMYLGVSIADPLTTSKGTFLTSVFLVVFAGLFVAVLRKGKSVGPLLLVLALFVGWVALLHHQFAKYIPLADEVMFLMNENQSTALNCVLKKEDLNNFGPISNKGHIFMDKDVPKYGSSLCSNVGSWESLPQGWRYNSVPAENLTASDGTFEFSARSRWQETINCSEVGCEYKRSN